MPREQCNKYQHQACVTWMTNDRVWARDNKLVVLLNTGLEPEVPSQVARHLKCEGYLACHRSKRTTTELLLILTMKGWKMLGSSLSHKWQQIIILAHHGSEDHPSNVFRIFHHWYSRGDAFIFWRWGVRWCHRCIKSPGCKKNKRDLD